MFLNSYAFHCPLSKGCIPLLNSIDKVKTKLNLFCESVVQLERILEIALGDLLALPLLCFMRVVSWKPLLGMGRAQGFDLTQWLFCASQFSASLFIIAQESGLCWFRSSLVPWKAVSSFWGKTQVVVEASFILHLPWSTRPSDSVSDWDSQSEGLLSPVMACSGCLRASLTPPPKSTH